MEALQGGNRLLEALPAEVQERLAPNLERVRMAADQVLYEPGITMRNAYFPVSAILAKVYMLETGASAEIALVGREGMVGLPLFLGGPAPLSQVHVQGAGEVWKLPARSLRQEFDRCGALMRVLLLYTQVHVEQMMQTAACNRHGTLEQRLCRWLLMTLDRSPGNDVVMTQEMIAQLLGVRREGITEAAGKLQHEGAIRYHRGHIVVLDRPALEQRVCECYSAPDIRPAAPLPGRWPSERAGICYRANDC
jgi:CRP-like cAMP-binding protein